MISSVLVHTVAVIIMAQTFEKVKGKPAKAMCQCDFYEDIKLALNTDISWGKGDV